MLSQAKTRDAYLEFLKIVKSSRPDYLLEVLDFLDVWKYVNPLLDNLMEMSTSEAGFMIPIKG